MKPLHIGVIGVANFGAHRRRLLRETGLFRIAAVCDRNPAWLADAAKEEDAQPYPDVAAMLKHPGLEGVVICTGADTHAALAIAAMRAKLPIFVEKPLCTTVAAVQAMMRYDANPATQTADVANVLLRHDRGLVGTLNCYHVTAYCHELRIFGTKGNLYLATIEHKAWFQERRRGPAEARVPVDAPASDANHEHASMISWHDAIRTGRPNSPALEDGVRAVLPVFAAERAAKGRHEARVNTLQ